MRLRYYLRGLAVGIVLTTIIFSIVNAGNKPLTDAQIRQRALALGMIESDSVRLSSLQGEQETSGEENGSDGSVPGESEMPETESGSGGTVPGGSAVSGADGGSGGGIPEGNDASGAQSGSESDIPESGVTKENGAEPSPGADASGEPQTSGQEEPKAVTFRIQSGSGSSGVSRDLAAVGLVEDAAAFDTFLCDNGYSKRLRAGTYEIVPGTSEEEIAKIITQGR